MSSANSFSAHLVKLLSLHMVLFYCIFTLTVSWNCEFYKVTVLVFVGLLLQGVQSDNGSLVYYLPGYNPYSTGTLMGVDGQCVGQQPYFSSGYFQPPVSYGSIKYTNQKPKRL